MTLVDAFLLLCAACGAISVAHAFFSKRKQPKLEVFLSEFGSLIVIALSLAGLYGILSALFGA